MTYFDNYCISRNTDELRKVSPEAKKLLLIAAPYAIKKYPDHDNPYHIIALEIIDILSDPLEHGTSCNNLYGLSNIGASCYLDSALFALFAVQTDFVQERIVEADLQPRLGPRFDCAPNPDPTKPDSILEASVIDLHNRQAVQLQLREIAESIRGNRTVKFCTNLRAVLQNCPNTERYDRAGIADAGDFLQYILDMFPTNIAVKEFITYGTYDVVNLKPELLVETSFVRDDKSSVIQFTSSVDLANLNQTENYDIRKFLNHIDDSGELDPENSFTSERGDTFPRRITVSSIINTPYLIFRFERLHTFTQKLVQTKIIPSQTLTLRDLSRFRLSAIVVYKSVHYTAYFRCGSEWYYYDDTAKGIVRIGEFERMLRWKPSPITNGTLYYYTPLSQFKHLQLT